jgi:hypothetical protein
VSTIVTPINYQAQVAVLMETASSLAAEVILMSRARLPNEHPGVLVIVDKLF